MVKAFSSGKNRAKQDDEQKIRKKHAKREAKLMIQVDQAKKDVRKAEQKATRAQTTLQEQQARLQKLEQELTEFRQASQTEPVVNTPQSTEELQTSSVPAEGRSDINASAAAGSDASATTGADTKEIQLPPPEPAEGRSDILQEDTISASATNSESANTPIEDIPAGQFDEEPGAQVYADISINPNPTEEDLAISSGDGSIPIVTTDENAWPPAQIREELAESVEEEVATTAGTKATTDNAQSKAPTTAQAQMASGNGHDEAEENLAVASGEGSIPVVTTDKNAWPPAQIREELAESIVEEVNQEHQTAPANKQSKTQTGTGKQTDATGKPNAAEDNLSITSGDGSMPVVTTDENAWPPSQIREELAESIVEEVKQEHQTTDSKQSEVTESSSEEEGESHEDEHEEGSSRPHRSTRRRTRSSTHQHTSKNDQES